MENPLLGLFMQASLQGNIFERIFSDEEGNLKQLEIEVSVRSYSQWPFIAKVRILAMKGKTPTCI